MKLKIKIKNIYSIINKIYRNNTKIYQFFYKFASD